MSVAKFFAMIPPKEAPVRTPGATLLFLSKEMVWDVNQLL